MFGETASWRGGTNVSTGGSTTEALLESDDEDILTWISTWSSKLLLQFTNGVVVWDWNYNPLFISIYLFSLQLLSAALVTTFRTTDDEEDDGPVKLTFALAAGNGPLGDLADDSSAFLDPNLKAVLLVESWVMYTSLDTSHTLDLFGVSFAFLSNIWDAEKSLSISKPGSTYSMEIRLTLNSLGFNNFVKGSEMSCIHDVSFPLLNHLWLLGKQTSILVASA